MTHPVVEVLGKTTTLNLLRKMYADRFYDQTWYLDEPFMRAKPERNLDPPTGFKTAHLGHDTLPSAVEYAVLYLAHPELEVWDKFLWTRDTDRKGQRIYVGGVNRGRTPGFQIHRHLHITEDWGVLTWAQ